MSNDAGKISLVELVDLHQSKDDSQSKLIKGDNGSNRK